MAFPFVGRPELPFMWAFEQTGMADGTVGVLVSSLKALRLGPKMDDDESATNLLAGRESEGEA